MEYISDIDEYLEFCWNRSQEYIDDVMNGTIVTNEDVRLAVQRHLDDLKRDDLYYDKEAVNQVFRFLYLVPILVDDTDYFQYQPIPWQALYITAVFGFYRKSDGKRRFNKTFLQIARKNGKTAFASLLQLYFLIADGIVDARCYMVATKKDQAGETLNYLRGMIQKAHPIDEMLDAQTFKIVFKKSKEETDFARYLNSLNGFAQILPSNPKRLDGLNAHSIIMDELHEIVDFGLFNVINKATMTRKKPMITMISSAGFNLNSVAYQFREYGRKVLRGEIEDDRFFFLLYGLEQDDDYSDSNLWVKANPSMGYTFGLEKLQEFYNTARYIPSERKDFLTKNLNIYVNNDDESYIDAADIQKVMSSIKIEDFEGQPCWAGIDLSSTRDLTALSLLFFRDAKFHLFVYYFAPNNPDKLHRANGVDISHWIRDGYIIQRNRRTIDYDHLYKFILELNEKVSIQSLYYDEKNSALLVPRLQENGIPCTVMAQTAPKFNYPIKVMEKTIYDEQIVIQENPCTTWNFTNVVPYFDGNNNIKFLKNKSKDSIDGAVSSAMAFSAWLDENTDGELLNLNQYLEEANALDEYLQE